jgi:tetratricopeptide (TPR) repeat protein
VPRPLRTLAAAGALAAVATTAALVGRPGDGGSTPQAAPAAPPSGVSLTTTDTGGSTAAAVARLQARVRSHPDDLSALDSLGAAYLQRMRETYDYSYLTHAETAFRIVLKKKPDDLSALLGTSSLAGTQHRFEAQLADARHALRVAPASAAAQGLAGDALAELGRYGEAFRAYQASVDRRPDLSSYARAGQARYLKGDLPGAGTLLGLALAAGGPVAENTEWARVQLGQMLFKQGRLSAAERVYRRALADLPGYHRALYGLGQVAAARRHFKAAARYLRQASDAVPVPDYLVLLGDVETAAGHRTAAADAYGLVRLEQRLFRANGGRPDLELALFDANHGRPALAVREARTAYAYRPSVQAAETLGWALAQAGSCRAGLRYATASLRLGTLDPQLLYHAAAVEACAGKTARARRHVRQALALNPQFAPLDGPRAAALAERLSTEVGPAVDLDDLPGDVPRLG